METHWTRSPAGLAGAVAVGGSIGLGARLIKHLLETKAAGRPSRIPEASAVPVEITPEEALELERQGTDVQLKTSADTDWNAGSKSGVGGVIRGAAGTAAALGAYKLIDNWLEAKRRRELQSDIQHTRARIEQVLTDQPAAEDIPLHASMKAAEDHFMKTAGPGFNLIDSAIPTWMSVPAGAAALIAALTSFRQVRDDNRYRQRIGDLRRAVTNEQLAGQGAPRLQLTPVVDAAKMKALLRAQADHDGNSKTTGYVDRPADAGSPAIGGSPVSETRPTVDYGARLEKLRKRREMDDTTQGAPAAGSPVSQTTTSQAF